MTGHINVIRATPYTVTLRRVDFEDLLAELEDAEDRAALLEYRLAEATGTLPATLTIEEADRLIRGKNPTKIQRILRRIFLTFRCRAP